MRRRGSHTCYALVVFGTNDDARATLCQNGTWQLLHEVFDKGTMTIKHGTIGTGAMVKLDVDFNRGRRQHAADQGGEVIVLDLAGWRSNLRRIFINPPDSIQVLYK